MKTKNNILFYYDRSVNDYIPWEKYKAKFNRKKITKDIETFVNAVKSLDIFKPKSMGPIGTYDINDIVQLVPTFRTQESHDWAGAAGAFEQNLIDLGVNWFVYVKFYIAKSIDDKVNIRPLVGKSRSLLVNTSGSDVCFSEDIDDGPARRFLSDVGTTWNKTQIMIIKVKSECQALFYEQYLSKQFMLFES